MSAPVESAEFTAILPTPFGALGIEANDVALLRVSFLCPGTAGVAAANALSERACAQFEAYLHDPRYPLELPMQIGGSPFQRRVWRAISAIPVGQVRRYGELSRALDSAARAVGQACGANPFPVVVPCHRVVAANGIGGFANARDGYLLDAKIWLLAHEGAAIR